MPAPTPLDDRLVVLFLTQWKRVNHKLIAIDLETYENHFYMIPYVHTIRDQEQHVISVQVDRENAIKILSDSNDMKHGKEIKCPT